jgi:hypothetical protein
MAAMMARLEKLESSSAVPQKRGPGRPKGSMGKPKADNKAAPVVGE